MKPGRKIEPNDIEEEIWKAVDWVPKVRLSEFFNLVIVEGRVLSDWQKSTPFPIWKQRQLGRMYKFSSDLVVIPYESYVTTDIIHTALGNIVLSTLVSWIYRIHSTLLRIATTPSVKKRREMSSISGSVEYFSKTLRILSVPWTLSQEASKMQRTSYTLLYADDIFLVPHNKAGLKQLFRSRTSNLQLNLNKTEQNIIFTSDPNETGNISVSESDLPRTEQLRYLESILSVNSAIKSLQVSVLLGWSRVLKLVFFVIDTSTNISVALSPSMVLSTGPLSKTIDNASR